MVTFLFWNLQKKSLQHRVARIVKHYQVDILILAESEIMPSAMTKLLAHETSRRFSFPFANCDRIQIYTSFRKDFLSVVSEGERYTIRRLKLPGLDDILLVSAHFLSKLHWSKESQAFECIKFAEEIRMTEQKVKHSRTILVGDLNMNPFEDGVVSALGLHSVMTRKIAAKEKRIVQKSEYPYFYNPMWGLWGDGTDGPAGTYYESRAEHVCHFWNMFDQVLVRPSLFSAFSNKDLKILMHDGTDPLINKHELPDEKHASDHFPILFKLNL